MWDIYLLWQNFFIVISYKLNIEISYKLGQLNIFILKIIIILCVKRIVLRNKIIGLVYNCYINMFKGQKKYVQWNICYIMKDSIT